MNPKTTQHSGPKHLPGLRAEVCKIMAFWAVLGGTGPLFYILLGSRYTAPSLGLEPAGVFNGPHSAKTIPEGHCFTYFWGPGAVGARQLEHDLPPTCKLGARGEPA